MYFGVGVPARACFACVQLNDKQMYTLHVITKARSGLQARLHMISLQHGCGSETVQFIFCLGKEKVITCVRYLKAVPVTHMPVTHMPVTHITHTQAIGRQILVYCDHFVAHLHCHCEYIFSRCHSPNMPRARHNLP